MIPKIIQLITLLFYTNACVSLPKERVNVDSDSRETICVKLKFKELFQRHNSNQPLDNYTYQGAEIERHSIVLKKFNRYGLHETCENPLGEYEVDFINFGIHGDWQRTWLQTSLFTFGLIPYWEQKHDKIIVKKRDKIILEKNYDYKIWGSIFLILAMPYFQLKYGASEVIPWLQIKEASEAIRKDLSPTSS